MIRRAPIETKINHERWLVSYADFVTLLFAFFVVMYSVSHVNENKYRVLSAALESAFSPSPDGGGVASQRPPVDAEIVDLEAMSVELENALQDLVEHEKVIIAGDQQWLEIELSASLLFDSGSADLSPQASRVLSSVAGVLSAYDNAIATEGHTDNLPVRNQQFGNNWALSSARAVAVVNFLAYQGLRPERLSAVGYGEFRPLADNDTPAGRARNRRVVLKLARHGAPANRPSFNPPSADRLVGEDDNSEPAYQLPPLPSPPVTPVERVQSPKQIEPVRLRGGGLLFSSDPDLPRRDPPVQ